MIHTFVSLTVEGHSTKPVHQERSTYPPGGHCGDLGAYELRSIGGEGYTGGGGVYTRSDGCVVRCEATVT